MAQDPDVLKAQSLDNPGMSLVFTPLGCTNFLARNRSVKIAIGVKMKLSFNNGKTKKPKENDKTYEQWIRADYMAQPSDNRGMSLVSTPLDGTNFLARNRRIYGSSKSKTFNVANNEDYAQNTVDEFAICEMIRSELQRYIADIESTITEAEDYHEFFEEVGEEAPVPVPVVGRRWEIPLPESQEVPPQWLARFEHLQKGLQDVKYQIEGAPEDERQSVPFTEAVMADELPMNCRTPAITEYDELSFFAVRQKDNEPLKEYLQRFNAAALEVPSATQEVKASAFSQGLSDGDFFKSLAKKPVSKFDALLARAAKYINMEDAQVSKKESRGEKRKEIKEEIPSKKPRIDTRDKKPPFQRVNVVYTPLTVPITQAFMAVDEKGLLTRPRSWRDTPKRPKSNKFCRFHNDYGHTTDECRHLKNEIERLIQNGYLQEYVYWEKARGTGPYQKREGDKAKETSAASPEWSLKEGARQASGSKGKNNDIP
ncbi:UNVERIFIED_CONTAM: hypothetical protein Slati_3442300 [Sesamum latifolium]|uniref:Retrotransposon Copia-like N-terminal domain-containing protein n=1 Tax=Sesamum latifolium TaxID=2727402 RepID=A0AAW2UGK2_9LAMI